MSTLLNEEFAMKILRIAALVALFTATYFAGALCGKAFADEPSTNMLDAMRSAPPLAVHAVTQCGELVVMWVLKIDPDGQARFYRTDVSHHPETGEEYDAFLRWAARAPKDQTDTLDLPCLDNLKGKTK